MLSQVYGIAELGDIFTEIGLGQYLYIFVEHGFDTWDAIVDITESDFDALGVKLGHRRKLQRKIANSPWLLSNRAFQPSTPNPPHDEGQPNERGATVKATSRNGSIARSGRRRYRRHPKPDKNAAQRPLPAYVIFSNELRVEFKDRHLSFTEIAKLVGSTWQSLSTTNKKPYVAQASSAKDRYTDELIDYKKTEKYRKYPEYLLEFEGKWSNLQAAFELPSSAPTQLSSSSKSNSGHGRLVESRDQGLPYVSHSTVLPGYRDSIIAAALKSIQEPTAASPIHII